MTADEVKQARKMMGVAQRDVALKLGVSVALVGHWETGRATIQPAQATQLARLAAHTALDKIQAKRPNAGVGGYARKPESRPVAASNWHGQGQGSDEARQEAWPGLYEQRGGAFDAYLWRCFP
jgi:transcriptional regulator with XRE-family HTH domain